MIALCCSDLRRAEISRHPSIVGLDYVEVSNDQRSLSLHFIPASPGNAKQFVPQGLTLENVVISGGQRITEIEVTALTYVDDHIVVSVTDGRPPGQGTGDFSNYRLQLINVPQLDPTAAEVDFSFKVQCPTEFDCSLSPPSIPQRDRSAPQPNYLAKDYASFRQLMLDRLATLMPQWRDRRAADIGVTMVELLAYVGDHLSYQQDAIATEAYLETARKRISVKRHARLVDYSLHDGQNARVWLTFQVTADAVTLKKGTRVLSALQGYPAVISSKRADTDRLLESRQVTVFELCHDAVLFEAHTAMPFYEWHNQRCQLPKGATSATLLGHFPNLRAGQVVVLEQIMDPATRIEKDADQRLRHPVLLIEVFAFDDQQVPLVDELTGQQLTLIKWSREDALPWNLCISVPSQVDDKSIPVAVVQGNVVLADHGCTVPARKDAKAEALDDVPASSLIYRSRRGAQAGCCQSDQSIGLESSIYKPVPPRYQPQLNNGPLTFALPLKPPGRWTSAKDLFEVNPRAALPSIRLVSTEIRQSQSWIPVSDLLSSGPDDRHFVVEVETQGPRQASDADTQRSLSAQTFLRFGDGEHGRRPAAGTKFQAVYRIGNGQQGNVGAESLIHVISDDERIHSIRNPLPAAGGVDAEPIESARLLAPTLFRQQQRAVTAADYAEIALRLPDVQRAAATIRWTGSWYTVFLTIDRHSSRTVDEDFKAELLAFFESFRMTGVDLQIDSPRFVPLEIDLHVCVLPGYLREHIKQRLSDILSSRITPSGELGFFHPDRFTFATTVYASQLIAATRAIAGVENVVLRKFQRLNEPTVSGLDSGQLLMDRLEIPQLDNDPSFPENGILRLDVGGGR